MYMMIKQAIKLKNSPYQYCYKMSKFINYSNQSFLLDKFQVKDKESDMGIKTILSTFFQTIKHLEKYAITNTYNIL